MPAVAERLLEKNSPALEVDGHDRLVFAATAIYIAGVAGFMLWHGTLITPDQFLLCVLVALFFFGRPRAFLRDWAPPILLLIAYDLLRGLVPRLTHAVHTQPMIAFDRFVFGEVPSFLLQRRLFSEQRIHWYDLASVGLYLLHFVAPLLVALFFWFTDRLVFKKYMSAMVVVSYLAFFTYCLFPAMPPWMASLNGLVPPLAPVMRMVLGNLGNPVSLPTLYDYLGVNPVAAVPSLHAAYPLMMALFLARKYRPWGAIAFLYPLAVWFAIVYLGEHYVFDIVAAVVYTIPVWLVVMRWRRSTS